MANLQAQKPKFSMVIKSDVYQNLIKQTLGDPKKAERYTAAIMSAVATNPQLQQCEAKTILSGSLLAESLGLAHSPQLGQYYLVPFKVKAKNGVPEHSDAAFILGYRGLIQLAIRSGYYKKINVLEVKKGELKYYNPFTEEIDIEPMQDVDEREKAETIGYYAMFEYLNGFRKILYWSKSQMIAHADKYSPAFSAGATGGKYPKVSFADYEAGKYDKSDEWLYSSFWYKNFDGMAKKTMLRQLISKWGIMSTEMVQAVTLDNTATEISQSGTFETIPESDFETTEIEPQEEPKETAEEVDFSTI
ncbi:MAG: recombinase RecT [Clostridia bacterium]|nr:recombinase RecT [Clostridia bacterium]